MGSGKCCSCQDTNQRYMEPGPSRPSPSYLTHFTGGSVCSCYCVLVCVNATVCLRCYGRCVHGTTVKKVAQVVDAKKGPSAGMSTANWVWKENRCEKCVELHSLDAELHTQLQQQHQQHSQAQVGTGMQSCNSKLSQQSASAQTHQGTDNR
jgi:hypothetical protein